MLGIKRAQDVLVREACSNAVEVNAVGSEILDNHVWGYV